MHQSWSVWPSWYVWSQSWSMRNMVAICAIWHWWWQQMSKVWVECIYWIGTGSMESNGWLRNTLVVFDASARGWAREILWYPVCRYGRHLCEMVGHGWGTICCCWWLSKDISKLLVHPTPHMPSQQLHWPKSEDEPASTPSKVHQMYICACLESVDHPQQGTSLAASHSQILALNQQFQHNTTI